MSHERLGGSGTLQGRLQSAQGRLRGAKDFPMHLQATTRDPHRDLSGLLIAGNGIKKMVFNVSQSAHVSHRGIQGGFLGGPWGPWGIPRQPQDRPRTIQGPSRGIPGAPRDPPGTLSGSFGGHHGRSEKHRKIIVFITFPATRSPARSLWGSLVVAWRCLGKSWAPLKRPSADWKRPWSVPEPPSRSCDLPVGSAGCPWGLFGGYGAH